MTEELKEQLAELLHKPFLCEDEHVHYLGKASHQYLLDKITALFEQTRRSDRIPFNPQWKIDAQMMVEAKQEERAAAMKEVLDWLTEHNLGFAALSDYTPAPHEVFVFNAHEWAEQLKKWQEVTDR